MTNDHVIIGTRANGERFAFSTALLEAEPAHRMANSMNAEEVGVDDPIRYEAVNIAPTAPKSLGYAIAQIQDGKINGITTAVDTEHDARMLRVGAWQAGMEAGLSQIETNERLRLVQIIEATV